MAQSKITDLQTPCLLVDLDIVKKNAEKMLETAKELGTELRPHMKTTKTLEAGVLMTGGTKNKICVSTFEEASFFAAGGFTDIMYAVTITENKMKICREMVKEITDLKLMFDSSTGLQCMINSPRTDGQPWSAILEVDCGYGRSGIEWDSEELLLLATQADTCPTVHFMGLYCHCGNSYAAKSANDIHSVCDTTTERLVDAAKRLKERGVVCETVGTGSTPGCNQPTKNFSQLTELHPGCYIFNDYSQTLNGSCSISDIAIRVATRVIGHKKSNNTILIDCGFLGLSLDGVQKNGYGEMCKFQHHPELRFKGMTQEIGKISVADGKIDFDKFPIGTMLYIYPYHACHTAAMHPVYYVHCGDTVCETWRPTRGW